MADQIEEIEKSAYAVKQNLKGDAYWLLKDFPQGSEPDLIEIRFLPRQWQALKARGGKK